MELLRSYWTALTSTCRMSSVQRGWPANGSVMGRQLTRLAPSLRKLGFTVESTKTKLRNLWRLESPPQASGAV